MTVIVRKLQKVSNLITQRVKHVKFICNKYLIIVKRNCLILILKQHKLNNSISTILKTLTSIRQRRTQTDGFHSILSEQ